KRDSPWAKAVPKPEVYFDQIDPDENGTAMVWYRSRKDAAQAPDLRSSRREEAQIGKSEIRNPKSETEAQGWKSIRLEGVNTYPHRINPLAVLPDGRLYGTGEDYVGTFLFNPRTGETVYCGPRVGLAPYTTIVCEGKLYLSGYPVHRIATALGGKQMVISTTKAADELNNNQAPEEAKLFVYDVNAQKIVREIVPAAKARTTGMITEASTGRMVGLTVTGTEY